MTDEQKLRRAETSRANGRKSRGPLSPSGKYRSSMNAIKTGDHTGLHRHDLPPFIAILSVEDRQAFLRALQINLKKFNPDSEAEHGLVRHLTSELFQYERCGHIEIFALQTELDQVLAAYPDLSAEAQLLHGFKQATAHDRFFRLMERRKKGHLAAYQSFVRTLAKVRKDFAAGTQKEPSPAEAEIAVNSIPYQPVTTTTIKETPWLETDTHSHESPAAASTVKASFSMTEPGSHSSPPT